MSSGVMIYIPSFIKIGSGIQKLIWGRGAESQTYKQHGDPTLGIYAKKITKNLPCTLVIEILGVSVFGLHLGSRLFELW
jgi:hypothetical protein